LSSRNEIKTETLINSETEISLMVTLGFRGAAMQGKNTGVATAAQASCSWRPTWGWSLASSQRTTTCRCRVP